MEGNQESERGPANRLGVQVLENSCYHRASQGYTSVQGPQRRLNVDAKSTVISQSCFFSNTDATFSTTKQFGDSFWHGVNLTPPQLTECVTVKLTRDVSLHVLMLALVNLSRLLTLKT